MSASKREQFRKALADAGVAVAEGEWKDRLLDRLEQIARGDRKRDRLTRDSEPLYKGDQPGALDEIVLSSALVHLERLSRRNWMLIVENDDAHFHVNVRDVTECEMTLDGRQLGPREEWHA